MKIQIHTLIFDNSQNEKKIIIIACNESDVYYLISNFDYKS